MRPATVGIKKKLLFDPATERQVRTLLSQERLILDGTRPSQVIGFYVSRCSPENSFATLWVNWQFRAKVAKKYVPKMGYKRHW